MSQQYHHHHQQQETTVFTRWLTPPVSWLKKLQNITNTTTTTVAGLLGSSNNSNSNNTTKRQYLSSTTCTKKSLRSLPVEITLEIFNHLDTLTLYQLTLVSRKYRNILIQQPKIWDPFILDPQQHRCMNAKEDYILNSLLLFLTKSQLHLTIRSACFDGTLIDITKLEKILRHLPYVTQLSIAHCNNINCYQILHLLKSSSKNRPTGNNSNNNDNNNDNEDDHDENESMISISGSHTGLAPFLYHLEQIYMQGLFPSERGHKSYALEMLTYGMIKKCLLGRSCRDLSESHYALYQFWLLLRSRMLLIAGENDFRPPWLPDELVQFIQLTEENEEQDQQQDQQQQRPIVDITPCHLCHKNVAATGSAVCKICGVSTPKSCAQCMCLQCGHILCLTCYRQFCGGGGNNNTMAGHGNNHNGRENINHPSQALLPLSATAAAALIAVATTTSGQRLHCGMPWQIVRCRQCHLSRRVCGSIACQKPFMTSERRMVDKWFCASCKEKRRNDRWKAKARLLRRNVNRPAIHNAVDVANHHDLWRPI
ncbi:hypothetical protein BDA99DRAFT_521314 [Phascolomyces articulosus]|uniref:F-box domain-containing protein n=1 Tax=Phascolomyces articulosus TaxID=60185 RepID=A0AAD5JSR0_9FUNG|nr:hypothetical protein BDA99DRAFT_521314 [Phascolomyces articulosus]